MIIVNLLITIWLLSCAFTCTSGLIGANRNLNLKVYDTKKTNEVSEFLEQYEDLDDLSSYKADDLQIISEGKKKKKKTTTCIRNLTHEISVVPNCYSVTEDVCTESIDQCDSLKQKQTTTKNECTTKSCKKRTSTKDPAYCKDQQNSLNRWKKIQNFFFGPPSWPFTRSYKAFRHSTLECSTIESLRPKQQQLLEQANEEPTITAQTILHPIPNDITDLYKEEIIRKHFPTIDNVPTEENMLSKEHMTKMENLFQQVQNETEEIPYKHEMVQQDRMKNKNHIDEQEKIFSNEQMPLRNWIPSIPPQQEGILSGESIIKEKKVPAQPGMSAGKRVPSRKQIEKNDQQEKVNRKEMIHKEDIPSGKQMQNKNEMNYKAKETLIMVTSEAPGANSVDLITEAIEVRQNNTKQEVIPGNVNENIEVPIPREDAKQSLKPETKMELTQTENETNVFRPYLSFKHREDLGTKGYRQYKNSIKTNDLTHKQFNHLSDYLEYITDDSSNSSTFKTEKNSGNISNSNPDNRDLNEYLSTMANNSKVILNAFHQFIRKAYPDQKDVDKKLRNQLQLFNLILNKDNDFLLKTKQSFNPNNEYKTPIWNNQKTNNDSCNNTESYLNSIVDNAQIFSKPTYYTQDIEKKSQTKESTERYIVEESPFRYKSIAMTEVNPAMLTKSTNKTELSILEFDEVTTVPTLQKNYTLSPLYYPLEDSTITNKNSSFEATKTFYSSHSSQEPFRENMFPKETLLFESLKTIPTLILTESNQETKSFWPSTASTIGKEQNELQQNFTGTVNPLFINDLWRSQLHINNTLLLSTSDSLIDYNVTFEYKHELNTENHPKPSTLQLLYNNNTNLEWKKWIPVNIPVLRNESDNNTSPSIEYLSNSGELTTEFRRNIVPFPYVANIPHDVNLNKSEVVVIHHPVKKSGKSNKVESNLKTFNENLLPSEFRRLQSPLENNPEVEDIKFPSFSKKDAGKGIEDVIFTGKVFFKNLNKVQLTTQEINLKFKEKVGLNQKEIMPITKNVMEMEVKENNKKLDTKLQEHVDIESPSKTEGLQLNNENKFYPMSTSESFQVENFSELTKNKYYSIPFFHRMESSNQPNVKFLQEDTLSTMLSDKYIHDHQNEKLLATEVDQNFEVIASSSSPVLENINNNTFINDTFLKNLFNQSMPEVMDQNDQNRNEFSSVQMSVIKIFHKNPEMLQSKLLTPSQNMWNKNNNLTETNEEFFSKLLYKLREFLHTQIKDKIIKKRYAAKVPMHLTEIDNYANNSSLMYRSTLVPEKEVIITFDKFNKLNNFQYEIPTKSIVKHSGDYNITAESLHGFIKPPPSIVCDSPPCNDIKNNMCHNKVCNEWKGNMQALIDKKRNIQYNGNDAEQIDPRQQLSYVINNNLQHLEILHKPLENFLSKGIFRSIRSSDDTKRNRSGCFFDGYRGKRKKRSVLGNKKMKSRELEFILEKNLPSLPLNKAQFITYMMTGMKKSEYPITSDDERRSYFSKANLQNLIDRNSKKMKIGAESSNKRTRKKQWQNKF